MYLLQMECRTVYKAYFKLAETWAFKKGGKAKSKQWIQKLLAVLKGEQDGRGSEVKFLEKQLELKIC
jgi:hypothetical protein